MSRPRVADVMTANVVSIGTETPIRDVAMILAERRISGMPVISGLGHVLGVVSEADILVRARENGLADGLGGLLHRGRKRLAAKRTAKTAGDAMTAPAITIEPERSVATAARLMLDNGINRLPVVVEDRLVGIVTRADLVRAFARRDAEILAEILDDVMRQAVWTQETVEVSSRRGHVTLSGEVATPLEADHLVALVERVPGVVTVDARLTFAGRDGGDSTYGKPA